MMRAFVTYNGKRISESEAGIIDADLAKRNNLWQ
jgi:hypothetical protein